MTRAVSYRSFLLQAVQMRRGRLIVNRKNNNLFSDMSIEKVYIFRSLAERGRGRNALQGVTT